VPSDESIPNPQKQGRWRETAIIQYDRSPATPFGLKSAAAEPPFGSLADQFEQGSAMALQWD
jgi:hypothetical protein